MTDQRLLANYARSESEAAFSELVQRHLGHVYSTALRSVCDTHLAQDVAQSVFVALARNASDLADCTVLSAWLHRTTRNIAAQTVRTDVRRRAREEESAAMNELLEPEHSPLWDEIAPYLDEAVTELGEADRDALLLRYFEGKSAPQIASTLGISAEAAQKRVSRALERLRDSLVRRGITAAVTGIATALGSNAVQAVPAGLAAKITTMAIATAAGAGASATTIVAAKALTMTTLQKSLVVVLLTAATVTSIYQSSRAHRFRARAQALAQEQQPLAAEITALRAENQRLSNQVRQSTRTASLPPAQISELLRLRGQSGVAQVQSQEIARLKNALSQAPEKIPAVLTNAMAQGAAVAANFQKRHAADRLARMKEALNLTDDQFERLAMSNTNRIERLSRITIEMMTGKLTLEQVQAEKAGASAEAEAELKSILTAPQLARLPEYNEAEKRHDVRNAAASESEQVAAQFHLSAEQQNQLETALYENALNSATSDQSPTPQNPSPLPDDEFQRQKDQLAARLKVLQNFLSREQIELYSSNTLQRLETQSSLLKSILPRPKSPD